MGHEVLAVDISEERVNAYSSYATHAVRANSTEESELQSLGIRNFEYVIVAIGANIQASTLATLLLKELNIPNIWVKAQNIIITKCLKRSVLIVLSIPKRIWACGLRKAFRMKTS